MTSLLGNIDAIRQEFFIEKFAKELENLKLSDDTKNEDNDNVKRIETLEQIINFYKNGLKMTESTYKEKNKTLQEDLNEINKIVFKKSWNRLPEYHKIIKMEEYIEKLIIDKKLRDQVITELTTLIDNKKLTGKYVDYDSNECVIKSILALKYDSEKKEYKIKIKN